MTDARDALANRHSLDALTRQHPTVAIFLPNTNELQRFVMAGAFEDLAKDHTLHYVLPAADAANMRAAAPDVLFDSNSSEIALAPERFTVWSNLFQAACFQYAHLSPSFAIRANLGMRRSASQFLRVLPKFFWRPSERALRYALRYSGWPKSLRKSMNSVQSLLATAARDPQQFEMLQVARYNSHVKQALDKLQPSEEIVNLLEKLNPLFAVVPSSLLDYFCNDVVWACEERDINCLVLQSGWDNLSSKGILHHRSPFIGCWGPQSREHASALQGVGHYHSQILGAPHYEFLKPSDADTVARMRASFGTLPGERLILFGGSFRQFDETGTLLRLDAAIESGRLKNVKIVYRPHPWRAARKYEDDFFAQKWKHVIFDPDMQERYQREQSEAGYIKRNVPMFDMAYLADLLSSVDAVISPMSTLLIESLIMKRPTMAIAFGDGKHSHDPSVTSQMTHFSEVMSSAALIWCADADNLEADAARLIDEPLSENTVAARSELIRNVVTLEPGSYAERLGAFCRERIEPEARKLRRLRAAARRSSISHAYGANTIARDYCGLPIANPEVPGYWMHGWIPSYHNRDPSFIALHKKDGQGAGYNYAAQIAEDKRNVSQWVSRQDQADYLTANGYQHVKAIGLPIVYLPEPAVRRIPGSLLVLPPHSHKTHGPDDPLAEAYAASIAALKPRFEHIWVGLNEDDIAKRQWIESFHRHGLNVFVTTDQAEPDTLGRLKRLLHSFEYVTTNGYGSHIALAAYCGARVSIYGPYADFPLNRMKSTHAVKMFPRLLHTAYDLCREESFRANYPFLFVDPDKAVTHRDWGLHEVGEDCKLSPRALAECFGWSAGSEADAPAVPYAVAPVPVFLAKPAPSAELKNIQPIRVDRDGSRAPRILFCMAHAGFYRNFEATIRQLVARGVDVHVYFSKAHETIKLQDYDMPAEAGGQLVFSTNDLGKRGSVGIERIRFLRDLLFYSRPEYRKAGDLRNRLFDLNKRVFLSVRFMKVMRLTARAMPSFVREALDRKLSRIDDRYPLEDWAVNLLSLVKPDLTIGTPLVNFGSREVEIFKASHNARIRNVLAVASWDNLTNKGIIKAPVDYVAVWNRQMANEAANLHGIREDRLWITGAPVFDSWFGRKPTRDRKTFIAALGLNPNKPLILYLCSSGSIAGRAESQIVKSWIDAVRNASDATLDGVNILVRPHPMETHNWLKMVQEQSGNIGHIYGAAIWPLRPKHPTTESTRSDFFDALYHADAVIGLNTSAMIEAAIVGRPVLTFLGHEAADSQRGNLHYKHLAASGFLFESKDFDAHVVQLVQVMKDKIRIADSCRAFVEDFVRPCGLEQAASELLADRILMLLDENASAGGSVVVETTERQRMAAGL